jgi:hypothetical protein
VTVRFVRLERFIAKHNLEKVRVYYRAEWRESRFMWSRAFIHPRFVDRTNNISEAFFKVWLSITQCDQKSLSIAR